MTPSKGRTRQVSRFGDYNNSVRVMRAIVKRIRKEVNTLRPDYSYATVLTVDEINRTARVYYPYGPNGDDPTDYAFTIRVGSRLPITPGQKVRIAGRSGDRYIDDVPDGQTNHSWIGEIRLTGTPAAPIGWAYCDGSSFDPLVYAALYVAIGITWGGTTSAPLLPSLSNLSGVHYIIRTC